MRFKPALWRVFKLYSCRQRVAGVKRSLAALRFWRLVGVNPSQGIILPLLVNGRLASAPTPEEATVGGTCCYLCRSWAPCPD